MTREIFLRYLEIIDTFHSNCVNCGLVLVKFNRKRYKKGGYSIRLLLSCIRAVRILLNSSIICSTFCFALFLMVTTNKNKTKKEKETTSYSGWPAVY